MSYGNLQEMIEANGITNFGAREIARRALPPQALWSRIIPTLQVAERLRAHKEVGYILVSSGYRDPDHNRQVGGAPGSFHVSFNALDLMPMKNATQPVPIWLTEKLLDNDPLRPFLGLGIYRTFVHIDTRGLFNRKAQGIKWAS